MSDYRVRVVGGVRNITNVPNQWSIQWVKFEYGIHPAVVINNARYFDNGYCVVLPITSSHPNLNRSWSKLSVPIKLGIGDYRWGFVNTQSITTVSKECFCGFIGIVPEEYRSIIRDRYIAIISGCELPTLITLDDSQYSQTEVDDIDYEDNDTISEDESPTDIEISYNDDCSDESDDNEYLVEDDVDVNDKDTDNKSDSYLVDYDYINNLISTDIDDSIIESVNSILDADRMKISNLTNYGVIMVLVIMIKEYGITNIKEDDKFHSRFRHVLKTMVKRNIISEDTRKTIYSGTVE